MTQTETARVASLDLAYVAGVLDARAHIDVWPTRVRARVTTRRRDLLEWLAAHTGVSVHYDERGYRRRGCSEHCMERHQHIERQSAYWNVDGLRAGIVLDACLPWLVDQRQEAIRALRALAGTYPADVTRNEVGAQMIRLGWPAPQPDRRTRSAAGLQEPEDDDQGVRRSVVADA